MITVHHEKETDFSKNGYGSIDDYVFGAEVNWELNGQFSAYLEYPTFLDKANNLVNKNILRVPVPFMDDQLFRIYRTRKVLGFIQIEARHIFYDLLDNFIEDTNIVAKNGSQAIDQLLSATQYPHRFQGFSNINTVRNARMVRYNPVEALLDDSQANTFVSRWGGEIVRDNFTIRMYQQMGSDKGVHIQHKKDLTGYEATFDESTVTTRIMPIGFDGLKLPEKYVDSPLIDLDNPKIDTIKYDTVKAAIGEYANAEDAVPLEEAYALLRQYAKEEYSVNHVDEPRATVKVDFVNLHNTKEYEGFESLQAIHQGDTVKISVIDEGFEITSRLVAFKSDPLQKDHYTSTTLGNHVYAFTSSVNSTTQFRNDVEQLKEDVIMAMQSASGKNRNFWGSADPNTLNLNADVGDNYFRANGEETMLYQYVEINGEKYWKQILDTAQLATIQAEVEKAQATANQAKLDASGAYTNAVAEAERLVIETDAVWQGKMKEYDEQVALIDTEATQAKTKAEQALTEAGISTDLAQTAKDLADTAQSNASTALSNASQAIGDFTVFKNNYYNTVDGITSELSKTAKITDLNGMVTESYLATNQYTTQGQINTQLVNYLKTTDLNGKVKETVAYQDVKETTDRFTRVIGSTDAQAKTNIAQIVMTDKLFQTNVMSDGNLVQNGSFANGSRFGWERSLGVVEKLDSRVAGWYSSTSVRDLYSTYDIPVVAGETLYAIIKAWGNLGQPLKFGMRFFDKNNEHVAWHQAFRHTVTGDPTEYTGTITVPANASHGRVWVGIDLYSNFGYVWFTDAKITRSATQSQVTQLADSWALTLKSGNDIKTQINASTDAIRLSSKFIHLNGSSLIDNATIKSAHIDSLNANKITGNTADFNTIRTGVLTANAVTATHIKAENALIDTIFGTTALIERLTSKTAFINSIKAMEIDAGKITTGTLNAANVSIVNLDVNKLSGNVMNFISGAFTSNAGSLLLSGNGIRVNFSNGYNLRLNGAGTNYYTSSGQVIGGLITAVPISGGPHTLSLSARRGYTVSLDYQGSLPYNQSNRALSVDGTSGNITIHRPIYESSGSAGLSFLRSKMGNVGWGLLLASTKAIGSGIFLADNGEVWIGVSGGYKKFA